VPVHLPPGTRVQIGRAAPNLGRPGGGVQIFTFDFLDESLYGTPIRLK